MNFSVHLNDELVERLNQAARESGKTRNALIHEAVAERFGRRWPAKWPAEVLNFRGIPRITRFEENRKKLRLPRSPLDAVCA